MGAVLAAVAVLPGLAVGSFLNVVAARLPERRSIVFPRSACGSCADADRLVRQRTARQLPGSPWAVQELRGRGSAWSIRR